MKTPSSAGLGNVRAPESVGERTPAFLRNTDQGFRRFEDVTDPGGRDSEVF
jgi:hypothetical protein